MDLINYDFTSSLYNMPDQEQEVVINEIKAQMSHILKHFIECTWGSHYNTVFKKLIKPYLDNPLVLNYILKSEIIKDKNLVIGKTGAKAFPELLKYLKSVDSLNIRNYLNNEFECF